jgi:hypothetical protein
MKPSKEKGYAESQTLSAVEARVTGVCTRCEGKGVETERDRTFRCRLCDGSGLREPDPVRLAAEELLTTLNKIRDLFWVVDRKTDTILNAGARARTYSEPTPCEGCHRIVERTKADPIRSGFCGACDTAFREWRKENGTEDRGTDRLRFCAQRGKFEGHLASACQQCATERGAA